MRRPQSIEKVAERHFFELSLVLPLPLAPGQQNPQSTKTSGFSSVLTHTPRGPSLAPAGQFTLCRQSRMEHKGLRPLINPGVFRQAGAGAHAPACCMPKKGHGDACSAHFGFCGAGFRWAGQPGREADGLPAFQRRCGSESASLRTELPPTKGAVETTKPDPVRRKGPQKPFSTVKSSDSPVFLFT